MLASAVLAVSPVFLASLVSAALPVLAVSPMFAVPPPDVSPPPVFPLSPPEVVPPPIVPVSPPAGFSLPVFSPLPPEVSPLSVVTVSPGINVDIGLAVVDVSDIGGLEKTLNKVECGGDPEVSEAVDALMSSMMV